MTTTTTTPGNAFGMLGFYGSAAGTLLSTVGAFYSAEATKGQLKSRALAAEFEQSIANMNARAAEEEAMAILSAGRDQIGVLTMAAGQEKATQTARAARRGVAVGSGSAAEARASTEIIKQIDMLTANANTVRAANAARRGAVNYRNQALMSGVSARNLRASRRRVNSALAAHTTLLDGGSRIALGVASSNRPASYYTGF